MWSSYYLQGAAFVLGKLIGTDMGPTQRSANIRRPNEAMRLVVATFVGIVFGFFIGASFPALPLTKMSLPSSLLPSIGIYYTEDKYSGLSTQALLNVWASLRHRGSSVHKSNDSEIWVPINPRGAERLPAGIVVSESDYYVRRLSGWPAEDLSVIPKYLVNFAVGYEQRDNIDKAVKKDN